MPSPVVAIVPAHNEAPRVGTVVRVLRASPLVGRVLVVDDGSTDDTSGAARSAGAEVLRLSPNRGKGQALFAGVNATREPVVLFADADLRGLLPDHVRVLVAPVLAGRAVMACGLRDYGNYNNQLQRGLPYITGERAVLRSVLARVPADFWRGFRVEAGINAAAARSGPVVDAVLYGLSIVPKWNKGGDPRAGFVRAATMAREVLLALRDAQAIR